MGQHIFVNLFTLSSQFSSLVVVVFNAQKQDNLKTIKSQFPTRVDFFFVCYNS